MAMRLARPTTPSSLSEFSLIRRLSAWSASRCSAFPLVSFHHVQGSPLKHVPYRFIETYKITYMNLIAILVSIGGWFLFQILLSAFKPFSMQEYFIRGAFLSGFGRSLVWWAPFFLIIVVVVILEFLVQSARITFLPSDEDHFRKLEEIPEFKRRFEESASSELQMGWDREKDEDKKVDEEGVQEKREREVQELLETRGDGEARRSSGLGDGGDVDRVFSQGYGDVR